MILYVADAFTTVRFSGNQAGVALLGEGDFPAEELMRALAGELKHSETAFVRKTGEKSFHIRYFTPAEEVDLCGHATIAAFTVLRDTGAIEPGDYALHTRSGDLEIGVGADAVWMDMASPTDGRIFSEEEQRELIHLNSGIYNRYIPITPVCIMVKSADEGEIVVTTWYAVFGRTEMSLTEDGPSLDQGLVN